MTNDISTLNGALTELGETMASNITSKGVTASASDGLTTLAGKILNIAEDDIITITANRPYTTSTEKTDLIVRLSDGLGQPLTNKSVSISDGTSVYSGLTNLNGIFTLYNVSVSQDTTFTATYSNVSDSVNVYYATKYDYGTNSNNSNIWTKRSSDSTGLERLTDHSRMYELGTLDAYIDTAVTAPCTIEYDFKQTSNFLRWAVNILNSSSNTGFALGESITGTDDWHHIKIEISSTGATFKADNGTTVSKTLANINTFRFRTNNEISELFFKNFVIY